MYTIEFVRIRCQNVIIDKLWLSPTMPASIKLNQLRAFVEISRQGSIRAASRASNLSQPALTKSIQELEDVLGTKLFIRRRHGVELTECGQHFFRHASLILEELRLAQEDIQQRIGLAGGSVNIGLGYSVARTVMPSVITQFHREYPNVKVRILEGQLAAMIPELRQGELDFTITTYRPGYLENELTSELLMTKEYKVVVRKGHPCEGARSLKELQHCNWTMPTLKEGYYRQLHDVFEGVGVAPSISVTCETLIACTSLVGQSDFVSFLPIDVVSDPILGQPLVALDLKESLPKAEFYLIQRKDNKLTPMGAYLARLFRMYCR